MSHKPSIHLVSAVKYILKELLEENKNLRPGK